MLFLCQFSRFELFALPESFAVIIRSSFPRSASFFVFPRVYHSGFGRLHHSALVGILWEYGLLRLLW